MIMCYVSCWDKVYKNVKKIEDDFDKEEINYLILNSSSVEVSNPKWKNLDIDQWYFFQLYESLKHFHENNFEYMAYISGDLRLNNFAGFIKKMENELKQFKSIGVLAPYYTHEGYYSRKLNAEIEMINENLGLAIATDCMMFILKKEVANDLLMFFNYLYEKTKFKNMRAGWSVDHIACIICSELGYVVCRDNDTLVYHPAETSYDHSQESKQSVFLILTFLNYYAKNDNHKNKLLKKYEAIYSNESKENKKRIFYGN